MPSHLGTKWVEFLQQSERTLRQQTLRRRPFDLGDHLFGEPLNRLQNDADGPDPVRSDLPE